MDGERGILGKWRESGVGEGNMRTERGEGRGGGGTVDINSS